MELRFAGSVPILGCDSFELKSVPNSTNASDASEPQEGEVPLNLSPLGTYRTAWNSALVRFGFALDDNRRRWRTELQRLLNQKGGGKKNVSAQVSQLLEAVR